MHAGWAVGTTGDHGGVYGIAKDGHVIYGPYNESDELWSCDDVDLCNGFTGSTDSDYGYASTTFFPYLVGCWGPAPSGHVWMPTCTTNGCGAGSMVGVSFSVVALALLTLNNLF